MNSHKKNIRRIALFVIFLLLVGYIIFQSKNILLGPIIKVSEPKDGQTMTYEVVTVSGEARNISYIYLNDRQIFVDTLGHFSEKLIAPTGYSIIKLSAQDKFGRKTEKLIRIILEKNGAEKAQIETTKQSATTTNNQTQ
jgi:hypothetical protein